MKSQSIHAYQQLIRLAHDTSLDNGDCMLILSRVKGRLTVFPVSIVCDEDTIEYSNWIEDLSEDHGFKDYVDTKTIEDIPRDTDLIEWVHEKFGGSAICIQWTTNGVRVNVSPTEFAVIKDI